MDNGNGTAQASGFSIPFDTAPRAPSIDYLLPSPPPPSTVASSLQLSTMTSLAARKAALFEKIGGVAPSASASSDRQSWSGLDTRWKATGPSSPLSLPDQSDRRRSMGSDDLFLAPKLAPVLTGSTVASTAVDQTSPSGTGVPENSLKSTASRVKLAIMAINAIQKPSEVGEHAAGGGSGRLSRSMSRMSSVTQVTETEPSAFSTPAKWFALDGGEETPTFSRSMDTSMTASASMESEEPFDTHPPDMVSPRTVLAHVVHPRSLLRKVSQEPTFTTISYITPSFGTRSSLSTAPVMDPVEEVSTTPEAPREPERSTTPDTTTSPAPAPPVLRSTPIILRGQGKVSFPSSASAASPVKRTTSTRHLVRSAHTRTPSTTTPARSRCVRQLSTARASSPHSHHKRRDSSVVLPVHDGPVVLKAQNPLPLRKIKTNAPPPMRFSMVL